jgi:homoserine O-succinyltransferase
MPLVAHNDLPTFMRLRQEGQNILESNRALQQDIRELHIGLLNMMPDAALAATERQFFRLIGQSNQIAQFYAHPFSLDGLQRSTSTRSYIERYYEPFAHIREAGLDALIITGANVIGSDLTQQPFWDPLIEVVEWAIDHVASTLCSCLATHAVMKFRYNQQRIRLAQKRWGVYPHKVIDSSHPLVSTVNTLFDVPHSRFNEITRSQFEDAGCRVLAESEEAGVHLAVSSDGFRLVMFQGHPEYDTISLLKEYKREVTRYTTGEREDYPPCPSHIFNLKTKAILAEYQECIERCVDYGRESPEFPEARIAKTLHNTWHDTAEGVVGNWMGLIYRTTHHDRRIAFMPDVDPNNPLALETIR